MRLLCAFWRGLNSRCLISGRTPASRSLSRTFLESYPRSAQQTFTGQFVITFSTSGRIIWLSCFLVTVVWTPSIAKVSVSAAYVVSYWKVSSLLVSRSVCLRGGGQSPCCLPPVCRWRARARRTKPKEAGKLTVSVAAMPGTLLCDPVPVQVQGHLEELVRAAIVPQVREILCGS